jgi:protein-tyrosine phosphatase
MKKVLFICLGNICRSPAAEGVLKKYIAENNLENSIIVDSAGTISYHEGELPDMHMRMIANKRGYTLDHIARKFDPQKDFTEFDYIITMDDNNYKDVLRLDKNKIFRNKIYKMVDFIDDKNVKEVPDPYDGTDDEFNHVIDLLETGNKNVLLKIKNDIEQPDKK